MRMLMPRVTFGLGLGVFERCDNGWLGVGEWSGEEVKELMRRILKENRSS